MKSLSALQAKLTRMGPAITDAANRAIGVHAELLAERARANAPVRTGALRDSIHVEQLGPGSYAIIADVPYAYAVHERPPQEDKAHESEATPEGFPGAKYLSRPLHSHGADLDKGLQAAIRGAMESP